MKNPHRLGTQQESRKKKGVFPTIFWVKKPRHSENVSHEKCYLYRSTCPRYEMKSASKVARRFESVGVLIVRTARHCQTTAVLYSKIHARKKKEYLVGARLNTGRYWTVICEAMIV